jgi:8-oxo-dGTP diphosphatase
VVVIPTDSIGDETVVVYEESRRDPFWKFPGGKIEKGETAEYAAWWELFEETGLKATLLIPIGKSYNKAKNNYCYFFKATVATLDDLIPVGNDGEKTRRIPFEKLDTIGLLRQHLVFLETFLKHQ